MLLKNAPPFCTHNLTLEMLFIFLKGIEVRHHVGKYCYFGWELFLVTAWKLFLYPSLS